MKEKKTLNGYQIDVMILANEKTREKKQKILNFVHDFSECVIVVKYSNFIYKFSFVFFKLYFLSIFYRFGSILCLVVHHFANVKHFYSKMNIHYYHRSLCMTMQNFYNILNECNMRHSI